MVWHMLKTLFVWLPLKVLVFTTCIKRKVDLVVLQKSCFYIAVFLNTVLSCLRIIFFFLKIPLCLRVGFSEMKLRIQIRIQI